MTEATNKCNSSEDLAHLAPMVLMLIGATLLLLPTQSPPAEAVEVLMLSVVGGTLSVTIGVLLFLRSIESQIGLLEAGGVGVTGAFIDYPLRDLGYAEVGVIPIVLFAVLGLTLGIHAGWRSLQEYL